MKLQIFLLSLLFGINASADNYFCTAYNNAAELKFVKGDIFISEKIAREGVNEIREVQSYLRAYDSSTSILKYTSVGRADKKAIALNLVNEAMQSIGYINLSRQKKQRLRFKVLAGQALIPDVNESQVVFLVCQKNHKPGNCILGCN